MTDLATLGIAIDSSGVKKGAGDLDHLTAAGAKAEKQTEALSKEFTNAGAQAKSASAAAADYAANVQRMAANTRVAGGVVNDLGKASSLSRVQMLELAHVGRSLADSLAAGQNPARALFLELGRIGQVASQSGGIKGLASSILQMTGILKAHIPVEYAAAAAAARRGEAEAAASLESIRGMIAVAREDAALAQADLAVAATQEAAIKATNDLAIARMRLAALNGEAVLSERALAGASAEAAAATDAAAAATVTGLGVMAGVLTGVVFTAGLLVAAMVGIKQTAEDDAGMQNYIKTLGLTDKEMKKLTDTSVTWGDITKATFEILAEKAGTSSEAIKAWFTSAFRTIGDFGKFSVAIIVAAFVSGLHGIVDVWQQGPALLGEALIGMANVAIGAVQNLVNAGIHGINKLADEVNGSLLGQAIQKVFGTSLPHMADVSLGHIKNSFSGTFKNIAADISGSFHSTFNAVENTFDQISARAAANRRAIVDKEADGLIADRKLKAAKAHHERAKAAQEEADALDKLHEKLMLQMQIPWDVDVPKVATHLDVKDPMDLLPKIDMNDLLSGEQAVLDKLQAIAEQSRETAAVMQDAFGNVGGVFGSMLANISDYGVAQQQVAMDVLKGSKTQAQAEATLHALRVRNTTQALSGIRSLFKEHSTGYKVMTAIEKGYALFQAAETIASIARDVMKTTSSLANSATRTAANTAEGGSKIFAELGPWAFPVVAAMVAVLAALGAKGHGGGGGAVAPTSAEDLQAAAGTGTVLGSPKDKSASIAHSLELVAQNTNSDLQYSNEMLKALRSIDLAIGAMAASVAKQINVNGSLFDTTGLGLGTKGSSGFLGLFSSSTTRTLYDSGIQLAATTVGNIIANGIAGNTYQIVEQIKKKSGFLGIGGGTKTSYITTTGGLPGDVTSAVQDVIVALRNGLVEAANVVGIDGAAAMLDGFQVSIGKVSFKDMTGQEIEDQLNAIFSSVGDQMAEHLFPALKNLQKVGEGLFETFTRVAKEYETVDVELQSIGRSFGAVGVGSIAARDALVQLFGGLDDFASATDSFRDKFLSDAEQIAPVQAAVIAELQRLGVANVTTKEQFKNLVLGLDLTTDAGRQMYASLLAVAPAFAKVIGYFDSANKTTIDGLQSTIDKFNAFADSLRKYRDTLFDTAGTQQATTALLRSRFSATAAAAATGDATALGNLQNDAKAYLDSARLTAGSSVEYQRALAQVAAGVDKGIFAAHETADYAKLQLDALQNASSILQQISINTAATVQAIQQPVPTPASIPAAAPATDAAVLQDQIDGLRADVNDLNVGIVQIAVNTGAMAKVLRGADRGGSLSISNDPDSGLTVLP